MGSIVLPLAKRFLFSKSSDRFLSFITWVSVLGVAIGVLALTVVTSVINGFEGELARVITSVNGHILVYVRGGRLVQPEAVEGQIRRILPSVDSISSSFVSEGMISSENEVSGAVLQGVDPESFAKVTEVPDRLIQGHFLSPLYSGLPGDPVEAIIGSALAEKLGATVGSRLRVIIPYSQGSFSSAPKMMKVLVVGITHLGMHDYDSRFMYLHLKAMQSFFSQPNKVTTFNIRLSGLRSGSLSSLEDSRNASQLLAESFEYPLRVKDWSQLNKNLFYAIELEKRVIAILLAVIIIVAAFNVVSTLMMMIHDKSKEIAILKTIGLRCVKSFQLFCLIGIGIGAVGTILGVLGGFILGWILQATQWIRLNEDIYYIQFLPIVMRKKEIAWIAALSLLISFLAALYPAYTVSRRSPIEGLRYE